MIDTEVTYRVEHAGKLSVIEHVPARVCQETGEEYFAPDLPQRPLSTFSPSSPAAQTPCA